MIDTEFLQKLDRFSLLVNKRVTSNYIGERESVSTGRGLIFQDHAMYATGDDFRDIDWKVFARTDKLYVKRFEEERNLTVHIIIDFSGSMNYGTGTSKAEYASMVGLAFEYLAMKNNERFVLSTFSEKLELFKPKRGLQQIASAVEYLNRKKAKGTSKLADSIGAYKKLINSRSMVVIISDFLYPIEEIKSALAHLKKHDLILVQVLDKTERNLDLEGDFRLKDLESNEVLHTFLNPFARKKYQDQLQDHIDELKHTCEETGTQFYSGHTGMDVFDVMWDILNTRARFTRR